MFHFYSIVNAGRSNANKFNAGQANGKQRWKKATVARNQNSIRWQNGEKTLGEPRLSGGQFSECSKLFQYAGTEQTNWIPTEVGGKKIDEDANTLHECEWRVLGCGVGKTAGSMAAVWGWNGGRLIHAQSTTHQPSICLLCPLHSLETNHNEQHFYHNVLTAIKNIVISRLHKLWQKDW